MTARSEAGSPTPARQQVTGGQDPRQPAGGPLRAGLRCLTTPAGLAGCVGAGLGLLALGPGLAPGYLLSYDMVFVPSPPFSAALLGFTGGPARAVPSDAVITVAAHVLPADLVQKIVLLLIFVLACSGAAALLAAGWRERAGRPAPVLACLACGVFYTWNPFVAERLLIGQWALLLGYAGLPWVMRELVTGPARLRPIRLLLVMLPAAIGGFAAMAVTGLAAVPAALARSGAAEAGPNRGGRGWRLVTVLAVLVLLSLPWLIPSLVVPVHTDPLGVNLFAARADTPFGRLGSLVMLSGIWNDQTVPRGYGGVASSFWLLVVACAVAGYVLVGRGFLGAGSPGQRVVRRGWPGLGVAGLVGLAVAAIGITSPTRAALRELVTASAGFAILRDGQEFVAALALTEAVGLGAAVGWLLSRGGDLGRQPPETSRRAAAAGRPRTEPAGAVIGVLAVVAPVLLLPGMAWGLAGRIRPVQYPADWMTARAIMDSDQRPGSVLVLPWAAYRRYPWNHGEAVYDPWNKLLSREVISNDGLQVGNQTLSQESPASIRLNRIVTSAGPLTARLRAAGVVYVVVDAGPLLHAPRAALAGQARLPGARVILDSRDLVVFELPGPG